MLISNVEVNNSGRHERAKGYIWDQAQIEEMPTGLRSGYDGRCRKDFVLAVTKAEYHQRAKGRVGDAVANRGNDRQTSSWTQPFVCFVDGHPA